MIPIGDPVQASLAQQPKPSAVLAGRRDGQHGKSRPLLLEPGQDPEDGIGRS